MENKKTRQSIVINAIDACKVKLQAFIRSRVVIHEDSEDIFQEIISQLIRVDSALSPIDNITAWLFRAARNEITDRHRKKTEINFSSMFQDETDEDIDFLGEELPSVLAINSSNPDDEVFRVRVWQEFEKALSELTDEQKEAFIKTEIQGLSVKQLSAELNIKVETALSRKYKAVQKLREKLRFIYEEIR